MKSLTISIDDDLFIEIEKRTTPDFDHGDVVVKLLRRALTSSTPASQPRPNPATIPVLKNSIVSFVQTPEYRVLSGIDKYLAVLGWVNKNRPNGFVERIENYRRGNRIYFGKTQRQVVDSGEGIDAKQIPGSSVWALATLDNRAKRTLLADVLHLFNFQPGEINVVVDSIPDSGRHRSSGPFSDFVQRTI
jgi:negative regulator of replication initiation